MKAVMEKNMDGPSQLWTSAFWVVAGVLHLRPARHLKKMTAPMWGQANSAPRSLSVLHIMHTQFTSANLLVETPHLLSNQQSSNNGSSFHPPVTFITSYPMVLLFSTPPSKTPIIPLK